jgi:hypothetical protein
MFKELIEKIKAINNDGKLDSNSYMVGRYYGIEYAKQSVIEIIQSYKPKVMDNPDCYGRWMNVNYWGHVAYFDVVKRDNALFAKMDDEDEFLPVSEIGGLWIHVLLKTGK